VAGRAVACASSPCHGDLTRLRCEMERFRRRRSSARRSPHRPAASMCAPPHGRLCEAPRRRNPMMRRPSSRSAREIGRGAGLASMVEGRVCVEEPGRPTAALEARGKGRGGGCEEEEGHWGRRGRKGIGRTKWVACSLPARRRAGRASPDPWIKCGSAGGPRCPGRTAGRDRATSARSNGPKSKAL
jgi:hypothetical protein